MMYQFIEITDYYLSFAIEVNIIIKIKDTIDLPLGWPDVQFWTGLSSFWAIF